MFEIMKQAKSPYHINTKSARVMPSCLKASYN